MRTITRDGETLVYPDVFFYTKGRFAYLKYSTGRNVANEDITVKAWTYKNVDGITLTRKTNVKGIAIFPIGGITESFPKAPGKPYITVFFDAKSSAVTMPNAATHALVGYSDYEIVPVDDQVTPNNKPAAPRLVLYPNTDFEQTVFIPTDGIVRITTTSGTLLSSTKEGPFVTIRPSEIPNVNDNPNLLCEVGYWEIILPVDYDLCTNGVFLKWIDKSGIPYVYRWTPEITTDEMSVDSTYTQLDEVLQPFEVQNKTLTKRYTLHSRIVGRDIYEMCKTIIGSQEVWMYDAALSDWVRCSIEEGEAEDSGAPMQDLVIEVVKREYNL